MADPVAIKPVSGYDESIDFPTDKKISLIEAAYYYKNIKAGAGSMAGGTTTMYTCPAGKIFILVNSTLSAYTSAATAGAVELRVNVYPFARLALPDVDNSVAAISISPTIPIILSGGQTLIAYSSLGTISCTFAFFGYEFEDKLIRNLA